MRDARTWRTCQSKRAASNSAGHQRRPFDFKRGMFEVKYGSLPNPTPCENIGEHTLEGASN